MNGTPVRSPRKGARVGPVSELSVFLKVKPGREQIIREVFHMTPAERAAMEKAIFDVGSLHQARYVLFDNGTRLLIATTFDGDWDVYIDDFAASYILDAWDTFLIHCEGYPDEGKASLTCGGDQGVPHREPGHSGRLLHDVPGGYGEGDREGAGRSSRRSSRCWTPPAPPRRSSTRP